jgi:hypothetical protein
LLSRLIEELALTVENNNIAVLKTTIPTGTRVGENPGFLIKKTSPVGFFGFYWVLLGFIGFSWGFSIFVQLNSFFFLLYLALLITL